MVVIVGRGGRVEGVRRTSGERLLLLGCKGGVGVADGGGGG